MSWANNILFAILILSSQILNAQEIPEEDAIEKIIENSEYTDDDQDITVLVRHPVNINLAGQDELLGIPGFNPARLEALQQHISQFGQLKSIYELQVIEGFDPVYILSILPYIQINSMALPGTKHTHEVSVMAARRMEKARAYQLPKDDPNAYLGDAVREVIRYKGNIGHNMILGFNCEKDAGEQLRYALKSGYLQSKFSGLCKQMIIGDYMASFGQGLTFGSGIAFGKTANVLGVMRTVRTIRPSRSLSENACLRGMASEWQYGRLRMHACFALNKLDAVVNPDSGDDENYSSITNTGYYRSAREIAGKGSIKRSFGLVNMQYAHKTLLLGFTSIYSKLNKHRTDVPDPPAFSIGSDYQYHYKNLLFFGEWSSDPPYRNLSCINGLIASMDRKLDISILYRHYASTYSSVSGNAFGESSTGSNERGVYVAVCSNLNSRLKLSAYVDLYRSPLPKYQADGPSSGRDMLAEIQYARRQDYTCYLRYKTEKKMKNESGVQVLNSLEDVRRESIRFHTEFKPLRTLTLKTRAEYACYYREFGVLSKGVLMYQDLQLQLGKAIKINARYMIFDTDDFDSRIYAFESDVPYSYAVPAFQGKGCRYYVMLKYKVNKKFQLWFRFARSSYDGVLSTGSGYDKIDGHNVSDGKIELIWNY